MKGWLCLDKRSLAFFRICLGLILLLDIVLRSLHFRAHYTREGLFPLQSYLIQPDLTQRRWSVFFMNDSPLFVGLLLMFFFLCALSLTVGYRTRLVGWLCWVLLLGVYRRNPVVNNAGDIYLPLLLLWGNFLPWGEYFSLDGEDAGGDLATGGQRVAGGVDAVLGVEATVGELPGAADMGQLVGRAERRDCEGQIGPEDHDDDWRSHAV